MKNEKKSTSVSNIFLVESHHHPLEKCESHSFSLVDANARCYPAGEVLGLSPDVLVQMLWVRPLCCSSAAITVQYSYSGI